MKKIIVWFRQDLRLVDNLCLQEAQDAEIIPLFILEKNDPWPPGGAARWWLHHSLRALQKEIRNIGSDLILRQGCALEIIPPLAQKAGATHVFWGRCYEPWAITRDTELKKILKTKGFEAQSFNNSLLFEPWDIANKQGEPFKVYTPFSKACFGHERQPPAPRQRIQTLRDGTAGVHSEKLEDLALLPTQPDWAGGLRDTWIPGRHGAEAALPEFLDGAVRGYKEGRNFPGRKSSSRLSPHLHWGEISPRQVWHATKHCALSANAPPAGDSEHFLKELLWREFSYHLLYHFPHLPERAFNPAYDDFPWAADRAALRRWQKGLTGYPIVDAGMRELWQTGWMHNRVRMIVASFLVKDLLVPWQDGARWFWDTLVDADLANNSASWQWVAGCGADAAPYFRIFNPVLQGRKFDPDGAYVRRYVPELSRLPTAFIHEPWSAPAEVLHSASIRLGDTYPAPMVDHHQARDRALAALKSIKKLNDREAAECA